jgi:mannose-6-phosphate isomerase-like protein (cupin superfamily)
LARAVAIRWETKDLPDAPDRASPDGTSEIRLLPSFEGGELAHATALPAQASAPAAVEGVTEIFYVLEGRGELRRVKDGAEEISDLIPGRCASMPPGVSYQYRATGGPLRFIVFSAPRWQREDWHEAELSPWPEAPGEAPKLQGPTPWGSRDLPAQVDYLAPDGSEIRLLLEVEAGGLAHCTLPAGGVSMAVKHRTVEEIWYVVEGVGELWRHADDAADVAEMRAQRCLTIPEHTAFQFRNPGTGPLRFLIGTFPRWPGEHEAETADGHWRGQPVD